MIDLCTDLCMLCYCFWKFCNIGFDRSNKRSTPFDKIYVISVIKMLPSMVIFDHRQLKLQQQKKKTQIVWIASKGKIAICGGMKRFVSGMLVLTKEFCMHKCAILNGKWWNNRSNHRVRVACTFVGGLEQSQCRKIGDHHIFLFCYFLLALLNYCFTCRM